MRGVSIIGALILSLIGIFHPVVAQEDNEIKLFTSSDAKALLAPPMKVTQIIPITINKANQEEYINNPQLRKEEVKRDLQFLETKALPWELFVSGIVVGVVYLLIRAAFKNVVVYKPAEKASSISIEQEMALLMQRSQHEEGKYRENMVRWEHLIRLLLKQKYHLVAESATSQEIISRASHIPSVNKGFLLGLERFFDKSEKIKYADYNPTALEWEEQLLTAKQIILETAVKGDNFSAT